MSVTQPQKAITKGELSVMKEQNTLLKLTEILFQDQLITPEEKRKLVKLIQARRSS